MVRNRGKTCRVLVLISGSGSNLQAIIDYARRTNSCYEICSVISNRPDVAGLERAANAGIDTVTIDHKTFPDRESFDQALAECIEGFHPDLVVLAGFMRILSPGFVRRFRGQLINIHPSLLPRYPGLNTHQRAIEAGDSEAGCTVHFVTEELDGGPPIIQSAVAIEPGDTADQLAARVLEKEHRIYPLAVNWFARGRVRLQGDKASLDGAVLGPGGYRHRD
jgi:phosphoribosylglycinamide formyltransferase-1